MAALLPAHVFPPAPRVPASLLRDLAAIEDREPEAVRRVFATTGKLVGRMDVRAAEASTGLETLAAILLAPPPDLTKLDRATAVELVHRLSEYSEADAHRALDALTRALDQPALSDLVFYPREELSSEQVVELATTLRGEALAPYLDPMCGVPLEHVEPRPPEALLARCRAVLAALHVEGAIEISYGEQAAEAFARRVEGRATPGELAELALEPEAGLAEVYLDDDALAERLAALLK
ncbi:MAG TPA: hypothetical protein VIL20_09445 [Sandaracinaceae bacterium]